MADDIGVAGFEQPPGLQFLPPLDGGGDDAIALHVLHVPDPDQLAVLLIDLLEGGQVGGNVVDSLVLSPYAVEVVGLDLLHQRQLVIDLLLCQGGDLDGKGPGGGDAGFVVVQSDRYDDLRRLLPHSGAVHPEPGGIVHTRRLDDLLVIAGQGDRHILSVYAEVPCGGQLDIVDGCVDAALVRSQPLTGQGVGEALSREALVQLG